MAKKDFTSSYNPIGSEKETTTTTSNTANVDNTTTTKRGYHKLDPREETPKEYRFTARFPGELGQYLKERAYLERVPVYQLLIQLVEADRAEHPEIVRNLKKEQKKRQGN